MIPILALDIATNTGWAVSIDGKTVAASGHWNFTVKKDESTGMRLLRFRGKLNEILRDIQPKMIVFENTVHQIGGRGGAHVQGEMQGVMKCWCMEQSPAVEFKGYFPTEIKKHATGKGNAKKPDMILAAQKKWRQVFESDDEVDARWILDYAMKDMESILQ